MPTPSFKLEWDKSGEHFYETGIDHGVLYPISAQGAYDTGEAWNGISAVTEKPSGAEATAVWADNQKYLNLYSAEEFAATLEAYTYPDGFMECDGSAEIAPGVFAGQQNRKMFGLSYRTKIGNDTQGDALGYKIHLIYGAKASPSERAYNTTNDSPEASAMSWEISTTPVNVSGMKATSILTIDSRKTTAGKLAALEQILYGTPAQQAQDAVYEAVPADATFDNTKTYYTRTGEGTTQSPYVYTEASITEFAQGTTYYTLKSPAVPASAAVEPRLPLPDEVASIMAE